MKTVEDCLCELGLPPSASPSAVRASFRRLVKRLHPDLTHAHQTASQFTRVVAAYRLLQELLPSGEWPEPREFCPKCRRPGELFVALAGGRACADCLLGMSQARRFLPLPAIVLARHLSVLAFYAVSLFGLLQFVRTADPYFGMMSLVATTAGFLTLSCEVLSITRRGA